MKNKKAKICVIGVYFGKFHNWIEIWKKSCQYNETIDFLIITDQEMENIPSNMRIIKLSLYECKQLIENKLGMKISLEKPYKLCDFKEIYGLIFEDYVKDYDYWGECDFDVVFGNLRYFTDKYEIENYEKFLNRGHLSFYKNTEKVNNYYKLEGSKTGNYKEVFTSPQNFAFDETYGINKIYEYNNLPFFQKRVYGDIDTRYQRFKQSIRSDEERNYNNQVYYWENGHVYRAFLFNKKIQIEELAYIHLQKRKFEDLKFNTKQSNSFFITNNGFINKENSGIPTIEEIKKYNQYKGKIYEFIEYLKHLKQNWKSILKWYMKKSNIGREIIKLLKSLKGKKSK